MIIRKIILDNIRSYEHEEIELSEGSTLLSGDIGSGKTSILLAIQFGLFGLQPGQRGSALLRNGKSEGSVIIEFEIDEKKILVERRLKKGKGITQDYSAITIDGNKEEISVSELKQRVLEILNYPSEFSKKQNLLYKFTVYTPQEEMKEIILEDPEVRLNTLRHVFGIDKYKTIMENAVLLRSKLREEKRLMEGMTLNLEEEKKEIAEKEFELQKMKINTQELRKDFILKFKEREIKEEEKKEILKKIEERNEIKQELGKSKIMLLSKNENLYGNEKLVRDINKDIEDFKTLDFDEKKIEEFERIILENKREGGDLNESNMKIGSEIESLKIKLEGNKKLQDTMSDLKTCPTCHQDVDAIYRANVLNKAYNEISKSKERTLELEDEKKIVLKKLGDLENVIFLNEKNLTDLKILKMRYGGIHEKEERLKELNKNNELFKKDILFLEKHLESLNDSLFKLLKYDSIFEKKEEELKEAMRKEKISEIKLAEVKKEIEFYSNSILELKQKIKKIEETKIKLEYVTELENWINKRFVPVISFMEKTVMNSLKKEFSKLFSEWFQILVPGDFIVRLSDDFTPIIEQQDYEIDYAYLSGGERTAIALAYRLALNQVINSLMSKIKTRELVILDEPTDGFSEQQLDKMRSVLEQLNVKQLIIVSHEQKIEGFVENVIKFKKEYGLSSKE